MDKKSKMPPIYLVLSHDDLDPFLRLMAWPLYLSLVRK